MSNMSYCKFENTYNDLRDCYESISDTEDDLSASEVRYRKRLVDLCRDIVREYESAFGQEEEDVNTRINQC